MVKVELDIDNTLQRHYPVGWADVIGKRDSGVYLEQLLDDRQRELWT
jgi:hypothetical protein